MKTRRLFGAVLIAVCLVTGCASNPMTAVYDNDEKIASNTNSYNLNNFRSTSENGHFTASAEKMEGMYTIWTFEADEDIDLDMVYTLNVYSGKAKIVLINPKEEVQVIAECDSEMAEPAQSTLNISNGNNRIKIVAGEGTKFDIDLSISDGEFRKMG